MGTGGDTEALVHSCLRDRLFDSAIHYAEELAHSDAYGDPDAALLLAEVYIAARQYQRALCWIRTATLLPADVSALVDWSTILSQEAVSGVYISVGTSSPSAARDKQRKEAFAGRELPPSRSWVARKLAAEALLQLGFDTECLAVLGSEEEIAEANYDADASAIHPVAQLHILRGRAFDSKELLLDASKAYSIAMEQDPRCIEALRGAIARPVSSVAERRQLAASAGSPLANLFAGDNSNEPKSSIEAPTLEAQRVVALWSSGKTQECLAAARELFARDPLALDAFPPYFAALYELERTGELYAAAHRLTHAHPERPESWYGVGCYYLALKRYDEARRHFAKTTMLSFAFAPGWVAFGHALSLSGETEQAIGAYRTAMRAFPGCIEAPLSLGMEYANAGNLALAVEFMLNARALNECDIYVANELGCAAYANGEYDQAITLFSDALANGKADGVFDKSAGALASASLDDHGERIEVTLLVNLAHALRKCHRCDDALGHARAALELAPSDPDVIACLGILFHSTGKVNEAISQYHRLLMHRPNDAVVTELLELAL